jgi:hypothetical protein
MTAPSLLPSLPPKGEPGLARVVTLAAREMTAPTLLSSLPPKGEPGSARVATLAPRELGWACGRLNLNVVCC